MASYLKVERLTRQGLAEKEERPVSIREKIMEADGQWLMGRVMPRELLQGIGKYLHRVAPEREDELIKAIKDRAEGLVEANEDMVVDGPAEGMLGISAVVLAAFETLRPEFDGDERRTILYLQHVFGTVLRRTFEVSFERITGRANPLDEYEKAVRKERPIYGSYFRMPLERQDAATFEMRVERCFFHDFFARHDAWLVTTVLCAWDANTLGAIDSAVSGLRAERTSLLSLGDDACRFRVLKTDDPLATFDDALERRFVAGQESG
jgi:L-2-amino-thiazoline-4-carboxylic acid hydrolase